jgi:hypothetical protein
LITLTPDSEAIIGGHRALVTFHDDGTLEADFSAEPGAATSTAVLTSGRGEWLLEEQGSVCRLSLIALMDDADRRFAGTTAIDAQGQFDAASGVLDGTFEFSVEDAGGQLLGDGSGTLRGGLVPLEL